MLFKANLTYVSYFYFISDKLNPDNGLSNLSKMAFYKTSGKCISIICLRNEIRAVHS